MWYLINSWKITLWKFSPWKNPLPPFYSLPHPKNAKFQVPLFSNIENVSATHPCPHAERRGEGTITGIAESNNIQWGVHWVLFNQTYQEMGKFSVSAHVEKVKKLYAAWISCICQEQPPRGVLSKSYSENMP